MSEKYELAVVQNAAELGMLAGETGFAPDELQYAGINDWIVVNAIVFDRLNPAGTFNLFGDYYEAIRDFGLRAMKEGE